MVLSHVPFMYMQTFKISIRGNVGIRYVMHNYLTHYCASLLGAHVALNIVLSLLHTMLIYFTTKIIWFVLYKSL